MCLRLVSGVLWLLYGVGLVCVGLFACLSVFELLLVCACARLGFLKIIGSSLGLLLL